MITVTLTGRFPMGPDGILGPSSGTLIGAEVTKSGEAGFLDDEFNDDWLKEIARKFHGGPKQIKSRGGDSR